MLIRFSFRKIAALNDLTRQIPQNGGVETGGPECQASCTFHTHYSFLQLVSTLSIFYPHLLLISIVIRGQIFLTASLSFVLCTFEVCIQGFKFFVGSFEEIL